MTIRTLLALPIVLFLNLIANSLEAQTHHWESIILANDTFAYFNPRSNLDDQNNTGWREPGFDDSGWARGAGGIGFGDGDDSTLVPRGYSLFLRIKFSITDTSRIARLLLLMDYDDGFVAFLNGHEVSRANMDPNDPFPIWNTRSVGSHEAQLYQGGFPEYFVINKADQSAYLREGENTLAIEVHNQSSASNDLSSLTFLLASVKGEEQTYRATPDWFVPMMESLSSDLPLVIINTGGQSIPDKPRIVAHMGIIENRDGRMILPFDEFTDYDGRINVEERGHSSRFLFPDGKHSLGLETQDSLGENNNVSILGMPKENDWVLYGPYSDKTLIRNVIVYAFGRDVGLLAPRTRFVNLIINGVPQGLFVWMEKIKEDKNRVDIATLTEKDTVGDQLTGGYIVKVDWPSVENLPNEGWSSPYPPNNGTGQETVFVMQDPKPDEILPVQLDYIRQYVTSFEAALRSDNFLDPVEGYRNFIDLNSWIDFFLVSELFRDTDAYRCSLYMYKDLDSKGGKLTMGPLWDYNYSMGNYENCNVWSSEGWAYLFNYECNERAKINPFWFERLMEDEDFVNRARTRWEFLRKEVLSTDRILSFIDQTADTIARAAATNFDIWPVLDTYLWPNSYVGGTYENEISWLKNWLDLRAQWLDANLPGKVLDGIFPEITSDQSHVYVYPNPFNQDLTLQVQANKAGRIRVQLVNMLGEEVALLQSNKEGPGTHTITWSSGSSLPSGLYFARIYQDNRPLTTVRLIRE